MKVYIDYQESLSTQTEYMNCTLSDYETEFWVVVLLSQMKDHLIPRRMQFTASQYLFSFQSYKGGQISVICGTKILRVQ